MQSQMINKPKLRLKKLAFYRVVHTLIEPTMVKSCGAHMLHEVPFVFELKPEHALEMAMDRFVGNSAQIQETQVQLRFCQPSNNDNEEDCEHEDKFPPNLSVKVNGKMCQLRPAARPVNITELVDLSPSVVNTLTVKWNHEPLCVSLYLVKKLTTENLLVGIKARGVKPVSYTRALIREKLAEDSDSDVLTTMLCVSMMCPLGKVKMSLPCRATTCSHLQCFDAKLYLQMNECSPTWKCPVCNKQAQYENLRIDGYFKKVLKTLSSTSDDTEIELHSDGSWAKKVAKPNAKTDLSPITGELTSSAPDIEIIDLISTDSESDASVDSDDIPLATLFNLPKKFSSVYGSGNAQPKPPKGK